MGLWGVLKDEADLLCVAVERCRQRATGLQWCEIGRLCHTIDDAKLACPPVSITGQLTRVSMIFNVDLHTQCHSLVRL